MLKLDFYTKLRLKTAIRTAIIQDAKILHFENFEPVKLPSIQTAGTEAQKLAYADLKSDEIINNLLKA